MLHKNIYYSHNIFLFARFKKCCSREMFLFLRGLFVTLKKDLLVIEDEMNVSIESIFASTIIHTASYKITVFAVHLRSTHAHFNVRTLYTWLNQKGCTTKLKSTTQDYYLCCKSKEC